MGFRFKIPTSLHLVSLVFLLYSLSVFSQTNNSTIQQGQVIRDGQTIVSPGQLFELGFFSPGNSSFRYVGIWYYRIPGPTVVWVANRDAPISGNSGVFSIGNNESLIVSDGSGRIYWSSSSNSSSAATNLTAMLMDTGNLILSTVQNTGDDTNAIWQSCEQPTDTYLPNMRIYLNFTRGGSNQFVSWRSPNDPSQGNYLMGIDPRGSPQIVVWQDPRLRLWRSAYWNNQIFTGVPQMRSWLLYGFRLVPADNGLMYFIFSNPNATLLMRFTIQWNGVVQQLTWDEGRSTWTVPLSQPSTECEEYNKCGNNGICRMRNSAAVCTCMEGFEPNSTDQWNRGNWSAGCRRRIPLQCGANISTSDGFSQRNGVKLPDFADRILAGSSQDCEDGCLQNCSCNAYAYISGVGCLIWGGGLIDIEHFEEGGETLFIRLASSELGGGMGEISRTTLIAITVTGTVVIGAILLLLWRYRAKLKESTIFCGKKKDDQPLFEASNSQEIRVDNSGQGDLSCEGKPYEGPSLPLFSVSTVEAATDGFANKNKLGQGGFGPVHKGILPGGQEIAVKRLSKWSGQGGGEFQNEMILIAKLQHRNLVRLLGYCIEGDEKMLIYEYMPNKSLDTFLFDPTKKAQLDWKTRFNIIEGIARGLLYLHRDSRLRIIHRDLKVSNILLDEEMNPKISDFGMARIFGGNQNEANTNRVVGTYGYMSPEYAMEGLFSVKSDVYSFGVLLLEIVSGQRNTTFRSADSTNLIRYAWNLWRDGKQEELIDPSIVDSCDKRQALQCIHVGMLCVQLSAAHRPTMSSVVFMLEGENASLPLPRTTDITSLNSADMDMIMEGREITVSSNDVTVTEVIGR